VRAEDGAVIVDLEIGGKAVNLIPAAVGEDGPRPAHELVQSAELGNQVIARAEREVIGVAQEHLDAGVVELLRCEPLDGRLRADGHEDGRGDGPVRGVDSTEACLATTSLNLYMKDYCSCATVFKLIPTTTRRLRCILSNPMAVLIRRTTHLPWAAGLDFWRDTVARAGIDGGCSTRSPGNVKITGCAPSPDTGTGSAIQSCTKKCRPR